MNNFCERVIVPCEQQREAFIASGVKRPIKSIPLGLDLRKYPKVDRTRPAGDDGYVFGTMGNLTYRKGTDILVKAFQTAFPIKKYPDGPILYIKTLAIGGLLTNMWFMKPEDLKADPRIVIVGESWGPQQMIDEFYSKIDAFVFPTRGEGFGLPPLEAMATGLPTICTNFSGCEEFMDDEVSYPLDYKLIDVPNSHGGGYPPDLQAEGQQWAEPDFNQLVDQMKYMYENREEANKKGAKAVKYVEENFANTVVARKLVDYLDSKL